MKRVSAMLVLIVCFGLGLTACENRDGSVYVEGSTGVGLGN